MWGDLPTLYAKRLQNVGAATDSTTKTECDSVNLFRWRASFP